MRTVQLDAGLYRTDADNGVTVLSEVIPGVRSVSAGIWVRSASAHESRPQMGVSHLLEHMVFKGTRRRSARDIALELEVRGGALDAFTSRDHTSFQARVLDDDLPTALDVLTDLVRNPTLQERDLELERKVVLEEISVVQDTPDELIFDLHAETMFPDHPYGYPILGTRDTVGALAAADLKALHGRTYHPKHVVIAAAGNMDHTHLLSLLTKCGWFTFEGGPDRTAVTPPQSAVRTQRRIDRELAQTHIVLGTDTFRHSDARRYPMLLLTTIFGSGMSSRLFQRVREELGLAYSVYSYQSFYESAGSWGVYVGTHPDSADQAYSAITDEMRKMAREGLAGQDLAEAKQQLRGQVTLSLESPTARMYRAAGVALYDQPYKTIDQLLAEIDAVTEEGTSAVAEEFFDPDRHTAVWLGPN